ncbi:CX3C chemokine receptor 1-like [Hypomesus transpacificus]|uniref:CX3C chemokine receptor 1-like n=1 Tax=Hypomesus transpacificus TaxID=137520 RepID=UPI001F072759|nr:CX3C chemokine receptor 1-like [Hypomesus transpacificus]
MEYSYENANDSTQYYDNYSTDSYGHFQPDSDGHFQPDSDGHFQPDSDGHFQPDSDGHFQFGLFSTVCYSLIFGLSLPGNCFLLYGLLQTRGWRTASDFLLLNLTTSDLIFTLTLPFFAVYHLHGWLFGEWACRLASGALFLGFYSYMSFLTALAVDRYVAIVLAVSTSIQAKRMFCVRLTTAVLWVFCVAACLLEVVYTETRDGFDGEIGCVSTMQGNVEIFSYFLQIFVFFLLPFLVITFCYVRICATVSHSGLRGRNKSIKLIWGIVVGFFVCWAPYNVMLFLHCLRLLGDYMPNTAVSDEAFIVAYYICHTLAYSHCCLNPLLNVFGGQKYRRNLPSSFCSFCLSTGNQRSISHTSQTWV